MPWVSWVWMLADWHCTEGRAQWCVGLLWVPGMLRLESGRWSGSGACQVAAERVVVGGDEEGEDGGDGFDVGVGDMERLVDALMLVGTMDRACVVGPVLM